jgi:hypothetical protein
MPRGYGSGLVTGIAVSVLAAMFAPLWRPAAARYGRAAARSTIKQALVAYELGRDRLAELGETVSDLVAEAQFELVKERAEAGTAPAGSEAASAGSD